jgi:hypothetical protein
MSRARKGDRKTNSALHVNDMKTKALLICGAMAGPFFTIAWFLEGLARANYDPMRHPISALSIGEFGWMQVTNFFITGILTLALALGLRREQQLGAKSIWVSILIGVVAIGFLGTGFFVTDPMNGYPPGTPVLLVPPTPTGLLHLIFSAFVLGLPITCFLLSPLFAAQGERSWAIYSRITAIMFIIMYALAIAGFLQAEAFVNFAGLYQRISVVIGLTWMTLVSIYLLKPPLELIER